MYTPNGFHLRQQENNFAGRVHSKYETELRFYVLLYLSHKYYSSITVPYEWSEITPPTFHTQEALAIGEKFETFFIHDVVKNSIYRECILEMCDHYGHSLDDHTIEKLLVGYGNIGKWNGYSFRAMYDSILKISSSK